MRIVEEGKQREWRMSLVESVSSIRASRALAQQRGSRDHWWSEEVYERVLYSSDRKRDEVGRENGRWRNRWMNVKSWDIIFRSPSFEPSSSILMVYCILTPRWLLADTSLIPEWNQSGNTIHVVRPLRAGLNSLPNSQITSSSGGICADIRYLTYYPRTIWRCFHRNYKSMRINTSTLMEEHIDPECVINMHAPLTMSPNWLTGRYLGSSLDSSCESQQILPVIRIESQSASGGLWLRSIIQLDNLLGETIDQWQDFLTTRLFCKLIVDLQIKEPVNTSLVLLAKFRSGRVCFGERIEILRVINKRIQDRILWCFESSDSVKGLRVSSGELDG